MRTVTSPHQTHQGATQLSRCPLVSIVLLCLVSLIALQWQQSQKYNTHYTAHWMSVVSKLADM